ncbi:phosphoadenosine phosphosulfate reductase family protein [Chitinophaga sp. Hz27]|uniref:phosphoadenosine phosphosulfate reductase family protein n=1 Tax=Chitinophaga sp. Hz27 TaxID=3347169 RepID=UPI0035E072C0
MSEIRICSVSGGKDSTALYCLMVEYYGHDFVPVFADTGNEHPVTLNYIKNLHIMADGPEVKIVNADFSEKLRDKKLNPSGNTFLDLMLWKGRAPSSKAQFCTEWLKLWPLSQFLWQYSNDHRPIVMHIGIRAGESVSRAKRQPFAWNNYFSCMEVLPMLYSSEKEVFDLLKEKGVPPNPLYTIGGMNRVGCYPCIHANKSQLRRLESWAWEKLEYWENKLGSSWFPSGILPGRPPGEIPRIADVREWSKTLRGGIKYDLFATTDQRDVPSCMGTWGICE